MAEREIRIEAPSARPIDESEEITVEITLPALADQLELRDKAELALILREQLADGDMRKALWGLVHEAAGAATAPLLADHPSYVFPSERVGENVANLLLEKGFGPVPDGYRTPDGC